MIHKCTLIALTVAVALLSGCEKPAAKSEQTIGGAIEAKTGEPAFKYVDPREGYKPRPDLCSVPPCGKKVDAAKAPLDEEKPQ